ncbi:MAG: hypothetical protein M9894_16060 [Planctomycetes bacterium]|nr:hypothetical protein [Planctomycetota bacterium]
MAALAAVRRLSNEGLDSLEDAIRLERSGRECARLLDARWYATWPIIRRGQGGRRRRTCLVAPHEHSSVRAILREGSLVGYVLTACGEHAHGLSGEGAVTCRTCVEELRRMPWPGQAAPTASILERAAAHLAVERAAAHLAVDRAGVDRSSSPCGHEGPFGACERDRGHAGDHMRVVGEPPARSWS